MRHYKDEDTIVLILSQNSAPAEEAEYPVPLEQDTSELLDAEGTPNGRPDTRTIGMSAICTEAKKLSSSQLTLLLIEAQC